MVDDVSTRVTDTNRTENVRHGLIPAPDRLVDQIAVRLAQDQSRAVWLVSIAPAGAPVVPLYLNRYGPPRLGVEPDDDRPALKAIDRNRAHSAYVRDVGSFTTLELAEQLGLHVHPQYEESGRRSGRRYIEDGRKLLSEMSAWPWTLAGTDGRLPDNWYLDRDYAVRLADWHYNCTVGAFMQTLAAARSASGAEFDVLSRAFSAAYAAYWPPTRLPQLPDGSRAELAGDSPHPSTGHEQLERG